MSACPPAPFQSLPEVLARHAAESPEKIAFSFLADGETLADTLTYAELARRALSLAHHLLTVAAPGDRVLLIHPPGLDYIVAVNACLRAGLVAVPAYPPHLNRPDPRLASLIADCAPALTLTDEKTFRRLTTRTGTAPTALPRLTCPADEDLAAHPAPAAAPLPAPAADTVAMLQYTSGSTSDPKGVVLTHGNLVANLHAIAAGFGLHRDIVALSWLPPYHDMGLIGFIFGTIHLGSHLVLMPPVAFVQSPLRWLRAIERFKVCSTGAPNFGYEHCLKKIPPDVRATLDLRSWKRALNGAEPVSAATLRAFAAGFAPAGFDAAALAPCYGLAEITLLVTGTRPPSGAVIRRFDATALADHRAELVSENSSISRSPNSAVAAPTCELVSSGRLAEHTRIHILAPESATPLAAGRVGEICVASPGVARGYWNQAPASARQFVRLGDTAFLRTGDLGFELDGELYVTGRLKDLIILRGRNHYPQDIELTAGSAHPLVPAGSAAAFTLGTDTDPRLVVVTEVTKAFDETDRAAVLAALQHEIAARHEILPERIVLLRPGHLPRTSSGKVRRAACRQLLLDDALTLAGDPAPAPVPAPASVSALAPTPALARATCSRATADRLIAWLRDYGATRINSRLIDERRTIPPYVVLDFGNQGLLGLQISTEFGGLDLTHVDALRVMEQVAAIDLTLASFLGVHQALGTRPIKHFAPPALQRAWLPALAAGRELAAFALTEPGAGSNPLALKTTATPRPGGGWLLHGQKEWIGLGSWAGVLTVFAQLLDADRRPLGLAAFLVRQGSPGLRQGPEALTLGVRGMVQNRIFLEGVPVDADHLLGRPGDGMAIAQDAMMHGRLGLGVMSLAAMKRAAQLMLHYSSARTVSTGRLLDNPVTLVRLHALNAAVFATEALVYGVASRLDAAVPVPPEFFMAVKVTAPELLGRTVDDLVQLLGGRAYIEPNLVPQMLRDARLIRIFEGPTETLAHALGAHLLRDAAPILAFVETQFAAPAIAARLRALVSTAKPDARPPQPWALYQAGDIAAHLLLLAATISRQPAASDAALREQTLAWLERLLADKETAFRTRTLATLAPAPADDIARRIAAYTDTIGSVRQTLAGEDHAMDPLLAAPTSASATTATTTALEPIEPIPASIPTVVAVTPDHSDRATELRAALLLYLAKLLETTPAALDPTKPLVHFGLDSLRLVELQFHVEQTHGHHISAEVFYELLTLDGLVARILADTTATTSTPASTPAPVPAAAPALASRPILEVRMQDDPAPPTPSTELDFSLFFFSDNALAARGNPYQLLLDSARWADGAGFKAVWVPERHFHAFGGLYPNPAVVASALSMITRRLRLRAGSVVLPLHHPARVAEEWAVVDNLSGGRVDLAFTPGWSANDFVFAPENYADRFGATLESLRVFQKLWRGETTPFVNGAGNSVELAVYPRSRHPERAVWLTCTRGRERFEQAGALGANVLTALLMQTPDELAENIAAYRAARASHGLDPDAGVVTLMLHTYLGDDLAAARATVREPLADYIQSSIRLWQLTEKPLENLPAADRTRLGDFAFERYLRTSSLIGTVASTRETAQGFLAAGVNELACLIDFGVADALTLESLKRVAHLRDSLRADTLATPAAVTATVTTDQAFF